MAQPTPEEVAACAAVGGNPDLVTLLALEFADNEEALARFGLVSALWRDVLKADDTLGKQLVERRFGASEVEEGKQPPAAPPGSVYGPWLRLFMHLSTGGSKNDVSAPESWVIWGGSPQYWRKTTVPGSHASEVMELLSVCWFDAGTGWQGVKPGTYKVVWRVQFRARVSGFQRLRFGALAEAARLLGTGEDVPCPSSEPPHCPLRMVTDDEGVPRLELGPAPGVAVAPDAPPVVRDIFINLLEEDQLTRLAQAAGPGTWVELEVGTVTVPAGMTMDVKAFVHDHTGNWKRGIILDTLSLVPVGVSGRINPAVAARLRR